MPLEHPASVKNEDQGEDEMYPQDVRVVHICLQQQAEEWRTCTTEDKTQNTTEDSVVDLLLMMVLCMLLPFSPL